MQSDRENLGNYLNFPLGDRERGAHYEGPTGENTGSEVIINMPLGSVPYPLNPEQLANEENINQLIDTITLAIIHGYTNINTLAKYLEETLKFPPQYAEAIHKVYGMHMRNLESGAAGEDDYNSMFYMISVIKGIDLQQVKTES